MYPIMADWFYSTMILVLALCTIQCEQVVRLNGLSNSDMDVFNRPSFAAEICNRITGLGPRLRTMCTRRTDEFLAAAAGFEAGIQQCKLRFSNDRWNCTTRGSLLHHGLLGTVMARVSKESAVMFAMATAGITYGVTQACWRGNIRDCDCDQSRMGEWHPGGFRWECGMDVAVGMKIAKLFMDKWRTKQDAEELMNKHNSNVGILAVKAHLQLKCRCFGLSGVCTSKFCWKILPNSLDTVGDYLKKKYKTAKRVQPYHHVKRNGVPPFLVLQGTRNELADAMDLIYLKPSPNYCDRDAMTGSLGTLGRRCNRHSRGEDGCTLMCCGRGYNTHLHDKDYKCGCKFQWCCKIQCHQCNNKTVIYTCK